MKFKIRASAIGDIMAGNIGLTDIQTKSLEDLERRFNGEGRPLTDNMHLERLSLIEKRDNHELTEGMKTYCKNWLKEQLYGRRKEIKSKYINKGHITEEDGFTLMCVQLKLGMVTRSEEPKHNHYSTGQCDLDIEHMDLVLDNKSSWSLDTFPMFDDEIPDKKYEHQIQGYMEQYNRRNGAVVYTLIDCPIDLIAREFPYNSDPNERQKIALNLVYTKQHWDEVKERLFPEADDIEFIEIPAKDRIKKFEFKRDREHAKEVERRVEMCQKYIDKLLSKILDN